MNKIGIQRLILKAKGHDSDAFTSLMQLYAKDMYRTAIAILMNDEDAADAIQDTILTCWEKIESLRETHYFKTWMTRILINKCYAILNQRKDRISIDECENLAAEENSSNEGLKEILSVLDEHYRVPMMLFYGEGYSIKEIAKALSIPVSTVQTRLARGRKKLAEYVECGRE
jgi:RNA polymerase sigma-70 factor (ECF subfamily)